MEELKYQLDGALGDMVSPFDLGVSERLYQLQEVES